MTLQEAVINAIDYETRIRDLYAEAAKKVQDPVGRRFLEALRRDEEGHLAYLESRLKLLKKGGKFDPGKPLASFSFKKRLPAQAKELMREKDLGDEKQILSHALHVEMETSAFYQKMVEAFSEAAQEMFRRFLEIENAHIEAVQAELDYLSHTGYWFDVKEFDME